MSSVLLSFTPHKRNRVVLDCGDVQLTKQSFKDECDINNIIRRYEVSGELPVRFGAPQYGVAPDLDLKASVDILGAFRQEFEDLPDHVQNMFSNDPFIFAQFLEQYDENPEQFYTSNDVNKSEDTAGQNDRGKTSDGGSSDPSKETPEK